MPNRQVHVKVGMTAAVFVTAAPMLISREEAKFEDICLRLAGALIGGYLGARIPDLIDPSFTGPNHRSLGHGIIPNAAMYAIIYRTVQDIRSDLLEKTDSDSSKINQLLVGFMDGLIVGHCSHLVLDSQTPKGLPMFA